MASLSLKTAGRAALDLLYPPRCVVCRTGGTFLCSPCAHGLPRADGDRCETCWLPLRGRFCYACAESPPRLQALRSVFRYEGGVRRIVHALKFGGQSCLAPALAALLAGAYDEHGLEAGRIVPVPLTGVRRRQRGYNQASLVAREMAAIIAVPVADALQRRGHASPQATSPNADERRRNVESVFTVGLEGDEVWDRDVLLIDDVATTGATLNACAAALLAAGAASVSALTLARED